MKNDTIKKLGLEKEYSNWKKEIKLRQQKINVGDRVKVIRKGTDDEMKFIGWNPEMDSTIGKIGVVEFKTDRSLHVKFDGFTWFYPKVVLKRVE